MLSIIPFRSSHRTCFIKKAVLKNFAIFTGKHLCRNLFLIKLRAPCNFIKKRFQHRCFPVNIAKLLTISILKNNCEWLLFLLWNHLTESVQFSDETNLWNLYCLNKQKRNRNISWNETHRNVIKSLRQPKYS